MFAREHHHQQLLRTRQEDPTPSSKAQPRTQFFTSQHLLRQTQQQHHSQDAARPEERPPRQRGPQRPARRLAPVGSSFVMSWMRGDRLRPPRVPWECGREGRSASSRLCSAECGRESSSVLSSSRPQPSGRPCDQQSRGSANCRAECAMAGGSQVVPAQLRPQRSAARQSATAWTHASAAAACSCHARRR